MPVITDSGQWSNIGTGNSTTVTLRGGKYALVASATFGGGNIQLQTLAFDGSTWVNVGSTITAAGLTNFDLPPGQYRLSVTTATAVYVALTTVPY